MIRHNYADAVITGGTEAAINASAVEMCIRDRGFSAGGRSLQNALCPDGIAHSFIIPRDFWNARGTPQEFCWNRALI